MDSGLRPLKCEKHTACLTSGKCGYVEDEATAENVENTPMVTCVVRPQGFLCIDVLWQPQL